MDYDLCPKCGAYWKCECLDEGPDWIIIEEATELSEASWAEMRELIKRRQATGNSKVGGTGFHLGHWAEEPAL